MTCLTKVCLILLIMPFSSRLFMSPTDDNYLFSIIFPYLESLHSSRMWVCKFVELNPFNCIMNMLLGDPRYEKLNAHCFAKCNETFCNKVNLKF